MDKMLRNLSSIEPFLIICFTQNSISYPKHPSGIWQRAARPSCYCYLRRRTWIDPWSRGSANHSDKVGEETEQNGKVRKLDCWQQLLQQPLDGGGDDARDESGKLAVLAEMILHERPIQSD